MSEVTEFWPMAIVLGTNGKPIELYTSQPCQYIMDCFEQFKVWQESFKLVSVWVHTQWNSILYHKSLVDSVGNLSKYTY